MLRKRSDHFTQEFPSCNDIQHSHLFPDFFITITGPHTVLRDCSTKNIYALYVLFRISIPIRIKAKLWLLTHIQLQTAQPLLRSCYAATHKYFPRLMAVRRFTAAFAGALP